MESCQKCGVPLKGTKKELIGQVGNMYIYLRFGYCASEHCSEFKKYVSHEFIREHKNA